LRDSRPDYVVILPWNIKTEVIAQLGDLRAAGTQFVTAIPSISITA
jgi:C-methyltransferase C-terminal domain